MIKKRMKTADVQPGMYVILPTKWFSHPFLKNEFLIESRSQIDKMMKAGIQEVTVKILDAQNRRFAAREEKQGLKTYHAGNDSAQPQPVLPPELQEVIVNKKIPADQKAQMVHQHSIIMMKRLMETPTVESIIQAKKGIADIVDLILTNDETSKHLLNITAHDYNTYVHSVNVGVLGISISKRLFAHSSAHNLHELGAAFFLHDLGKVNIDPAIISKPAVLTDSEMTEMRKHPEFGYEILKKTHQLTEECRTIVLHHHERYDGTGYPLGLKGEDIHLYGRICSLADVYDALNSDRPYRNGLGPFAALKVMKEEMLHHFQKDLFEKFVIMFS
jgi:HD-GYP domain-containing protein (c-di-GMP phosphodiesterase class II)